MNAKISNPNSPQPQAETCAMAVVMCQGKILATVENIYGKQTLSLPKGHQEPGETLLQTATRECFEETNVAISPLEVVRQLPPYTYCFSTPQGIFVEKTVVPFLFEIGSFGHPLPKEKRMLSVQWMDVQQFLQQCTHQNVRQVVLQVVQ